MSLLQSLHQHYLSSPLPPSSTSFPLSVSNKYFSAAVAVTVNPTVSSDGLILAFSSSSALSAVASELASPAHGDSGGEFKILAHIASSSEEEASLRRSQYPETDGAEDTLAMKALDAGWEYCIVRLDDLSLGMSDREKEGFARVVEAVDMSCWSGRVEKGKAAVNTSAKREELEMDVNAPPPAPGGEGEVEKVEGAAETTEQPPAPPPSSSASAESPVEDFESASAALLSALTAQGSASGGSSSVEEDNAMADQLEKLMASVGQIREKSMTGGFKTDEERKKAAAEAAEKMMGMMGMDKDDFWDEAAGEEE